MIRTIPLELTGKRVTLRPLIQEDFRQWQEVRRRCHDWLTVWEPRSPSGAPDTVEDPRAFAARCGARDRERQLGTGYGFGIFLGKRSGGEINVSNIVRGALLGCVIGYWIDEELAGNRYMPESVAVVLRFAFEDLGLHRVEAGIIPRNHRSRRVMEILGIREEGLSQRYLQINGVWEDHLRFAITAEEWDDRRDDFTRTWISRA